MSFSKFHPDVKKKYEAVKKANGGAAPQLSQMNDISTKTLVLWGCAEVKKFGGDEEEARGQCFQFQGAGVQSLRTLTQSDDDDDRLPPILGWVVVGHRWDLYMGVGMGNDLKSDGIVIYGPIPFLDVKTSDYFETFKLLRLIERTKKWAATDLWEWYRQAVLDPLKFRDGGDHGEGNDGGDEGIVEA